MAKKKMGRPPKGEGRPYKLDVRLWEVVHHRLEKLVEAGNGKLSKADIVNWAILNYDFDDVKTQVDMFDADMAMQDFDAEFESDDD